MIIHQLASSLTLLGVMAQGVHLDWQLAVQQQVRAGESVTPGVAESSTVTVAEIVAPSGQLHLTFNRAKQDLLLRYQPRVLDTLQYIPGGGGHSWSGWSAMHRVLLQYAVGEERSLELKAAINFAAGKLDTNEPGTAVEQSGILPGRLGSLIDYTNVRGTFALTHRLNRWLRLSSTQTAGIIQYPANPGLGYFANMPALTGATTAGNETQLRIGSREEAEVIVDARNSIFVDMEFLDVSYQETASYPSFIPAAAWTHQFSTVSKLRLHGGVMKYWTNPVPGIIKKPRFLTVADVTFDHTFLTSGLPHLSTHMTAGLAPFFNLQYSSIEPRTTVLLQLTYATTPSVSFTGSARLLSSVFAGFGGLETLPGGHPKNIYLLNFGVHYTYRDILTVDANAYASDQSYQASATQPYTELRQVYMMLGVRGTWETRPRR